MTLLAHNQNGIHKFKTEADTSYLANYAIRGQGTEREDQKYLLNLSH